MIFVKVKEIWGKLTQVNQSDYLSVEEVKIYLLHYKQTRFFKHHFDQKLRSYYKQSRYVKKGRDFIMNGQDFRDDRSRFS